MHTQAPQHGDADTEPTPPPPCRLPSASVFTAHTAPRCAPYGRRPQPPCSHFPSKPLYRDSSAPSSPHCALPQPQPLREPRSDPAATAAQDPARVPPLASTDCSSDGCELVSPSAAASRSVPILCRTGATAKAPKEVRPPPPSPPALSPAACERSHTLVGHTHRSNAYGSAAAPPSLRDVAIPAPVELDVHSAPPPRRSGDRHTSALSKRTHRRPALPRRARRTVRLLVD